jgi:hypothetical protein
VTAAATTSPEAFAREVQARRARDGIWDGRSKPTAVLAAARRRQAPPPTRAAVQRPLRVARLVTTPEKFQAELDARRAADLERRGWLRK